MGHSPGRGIITKLQLQTVDKVIFVAPTAGDEQQKMLRRYSPEVTVGMRTTSSDGIKYITKTYFQSVAGVVWEDEYHKLLRRYSKAYVFESGAKEIVSQVRLYTVSCRSRDIKS